MGKRKHIAAEKRKEALKSLYFAKLKGVPSSPRKMRYVVDMVRGMEVNRALGVLRFSKKQAAADVEKLLRSAIANWEVKNDSKAKDGELYFVISFGINKQSNVITTFTYTITASLWSWSHTLHCYAFVYKHF